MLLLRFLIFCDSYDETKYRDHCESYLISGQCCVPASNWKKQQWLHKHLCINSLRPRPNRRHFADDIFKCIFENENEWISPRMSLKVVPRVRFNNIPSLVQIMAWRRPGDKPLSEPMMVSLLTHICVTRSQWVNTPFPYHMLQYVPKNMHTVLLCSRLGLAWLATTRVAMYWFKCSVLFSPCGGLSHYE